MFQLPSRFVRFVDSVFGAGPPGRDRKHCCCNAILQQCFRSLGPREAPEFSEIFQTCLFRLWMGVRICYCPEVWGHDPKHGGGHPLIQVQSGCGALWSFVCVRIIYSTSGLRLSAPPLDLGALWLPGAVVFPMCEDHLEYAWLPGVAPPR